MLTLLDVSSLTLLYVRPVCVCTRMCLLMCVHLSTYWEARGGCHVFFSVSLFYSYETESPTEPEGCDWRGVGWFQQSSCLCIPYPKCWGYRPCVTFMWVQGTPTQVPMLHSKPFPPEPPHKAIMSPWACALLTGAHV